ncbi:MAG: cell surface protein [Bacteroidaceae bacterium]
MRNFLKLGLLLCTATFIYSCSSDDNDPQPTVELQTNLTTDRFKPIELVASPTAVEGVTYTWYLLDSPETKAEETSAKIVLGHAHKLAFIRKEEGNYVIELAVTTAQSTKTYETTVSVAHEAVDYSSSIDKIYDFLPAVGQFTNALPSWTEGMTSEDMCQEVESKIAKGASSMISLGGFGGYVVFGFDHSVINEEGMCDLRIKGNAFWSANRIADSDGNTRGGSCEPGIISVSIDANHNGLADDQWYEIAGSEYNKETTIKNYTITYNRPVAIDDVTTSDSIKWSNNQNEEGWLVKNAFHRQSYYPLWLTGDSYNLTGTKLANNGVDTNGQGTYWVLYSYAWGYADNSTNTDPASAIDLDWAVDENGEAVHLPYADFIKVQTGVQQVCGWLGENSTEVAGAVDLHLENTVITTEEAQQYTIQP